MSLRTYLSASTRSVSRRRSLPLALRRLWSSASPPLDVDTTRTIKDEDAMPLDAILRKTVDAAGPMPVARYMNLCLSHPTLGYYTTKKDVVGQKGDFITSPEISQVFGELIAIWLMTRWQAHGQPKKIRLLELGPGRGTLMVDILRTLNSFPEVAEGLEAVDLVESSEVMKALQQKALAGQANVRWSDTIESVPHSDAFTIFVAHEFFDALPIHIFQRAPSPTPSSPPTFLELLVSHTPPSEHLHLTLSPSPTPMSTYLPTTSAHFAAVLEGERIEVSPAAHTIMSKLGKLLEPRDGRGGGAGLVVDYGKDGLTSESFRAFKNHASVSPFDQPGTADLTANVDFRFLASSLPPTSIRTLGPMTQADFLEQMGISIRLSELLKQPSLSEETKTSLEEAIERLVDRNAMGSEYQFFGVESRGAEEPGGRDSPYPFPSPETP